MNVANFMDKMYHSKNFFVHKLLDLLLSRMVKGGLVYKQLEKEIVENCPVQDFAKYRA